MRRRWACSARRHPRSSSITERGSLIGTLPSPTSASYVPPLFSAQQGPKIYRAPIRRVRPIDFTKERSASSGDAYLDGVEEGLDTSHEQRGCFRVVGLERGVCKQVLVAGIDEQFG